MIKEALESVQREDNAHRRAGRKLQGVGETCKDRKGTQSYLEVSRIGQTEGMSSCLFGFSASTSDTLGKKTTQVFVSRGQ